jgi:hypothetical protein
VIASLAHVPEPLASLPPRHVLDLYAEAALDREGRPEATQLRAALEPLAAALVRAAFRVTP